MTASSLNFALALATEGIPCFPCAPTKRPSCPHGFHDASTDPAALRELWRRYPGELVGVPTGEASGVDVLDLDAKHREAFDWCALHHKRLPATRVHETRSGGIHVLFRHAPNLRCSASRLARGVDVRTAPLADWPQWLLDQLQSVPQLQPAPRTQVPDMFALGQLVRRVAAAHEGERNALTFWAACRAGEMVASKLLDAESAAAVIAEAAVRAGLTRTEAERTARSGIRKTAGGAGV
jgi:hypothetical protein